MSSIDLSTLPAPQVVVPLDYPTILSQMIADLVTRDPLYTSIVESDPAYKILEVCAYREFLLRQDMNDSARAVMLAYAIGPDLDQLGADFNVVRKILVAADPTTVPPTVQVLEADADYRARIQISLNQLSTAGASKSYKYWALTVTGIVDATIASPSPGSVVVTVLGSTGTGTPSPSVISLVAAALNSDNVRPLTDNVTVQAPVVVNYTISAVVYTLAGPDPLIVIANCNAAATAYIASIRKLGADITLSGIYAALHQPGVQRVVLSSPSADISIADDHVGFCTAISLSNGGVAS